MVDSALPMQGAWVQSMVRELRSHMLHAAAKTKQNKEKNGIQRTERRPMKTWSVGRYTFGQTLEKYNIHSEP